MYYDCLQLDPTLPVPAPVVEIDVPHEKPTPIDGAAVMRAPGPVRYSATSGASSSGSTVARPAQAPVAASSFAASLEESPEDRIQMLQEVKMYMEVLEKFEGVIHDDFLAKRRRELFEALPSVPTSSAERTRKRQRRD